jgi:hypothetical protein
MLETCTVDDNRYLESFTMFREAVYRMFALMLAQLPLSIVVAADGVPPQLLSVFMNAHGKEISDDSSASCRLSFDEYRSGSQQAASVRWSNECTEWCGTGGCRT